MISKWRLIETAPKNDNVTIVCVMKEKNTIVTFARNLRGLGWWTDGTSNVSRPIKPTHWMALPSPPKQVQFK